MAKSIQWYLDKYGESHQNRTNKIIHWVCVPLIMFSLIGLLFAIPFPVKKDMLLNWGAVFLGLALIFYIRLSIPMFLGFIVIAGLILFGLGSIYEAVGRIDSRLALVCVVIFALAWVGQFIGHSIEGKKPSFFDDLKFLLIGPAWLLHFIYRKMGIPY